MSHELPILPTVHYLRAYSQIKLNSDSQTTLVGWVNNIGDIMVGGIDHKSGKVLPEVKLKDELNKDDHANPSIMMLQVLRQ